MKNKKLVIIGAGGFGREVLALINRINEYSNEAFEVIGFIDENVSLHDVTIAGKKVLGGIDWINSYSNGVLYVVCAIGTGAIRKNIIKSIKNSNVIFPTLIDPSVVILGECRIGEGSIICANNIISVQTEVMEHVIINLSCTIGHDAIIEQFCTINPGSNISGFVKIGECTDIGTGTKIIQYVTIGKNVVSGAGAVIIKDIDDFATVVGVPAKVVKLHS